MNHQNLHQISQIPSQTGCYLLKDQQENILYIGKAKNLRQRIKQHFQAQPNKYLGLIKD
jgi:excinuclease UvrABC nuclease subunit